MSLFDLCDAQYRQILNAKVDQSTLVWFCRNMVSEEMTGLEQSTAESKHDLVFHSLKAYSVTFMGLVVCKKDDRHTIEVFSDTKVAVIEEFKRLGYRVIGFNLIVIVTDSPSSEPS
jgi:hypothetical protein